MARHSAQRHAHGAGAHAGERLSCASVQTFLASSLLGFGSLPAGDCTFAVHAGASRCRRCVQSQARWPDDSAFTMLPGVDGAAAAQLAAAAAGGNGLLPALLKGLRERPADAQKVLRKVLGNEVRPPPTL